MKLSVSQVVVFRTPRFPWESSISDCWNELKAAIAISSPEFYATIRETTFEDFENLPEKIKFTLWKYFNRAKFRATPFGTFSAFGVAHMQHMQHTEKLVIADTRIEHSFVDWPVKNQLTFDYDKLIRTRDIKLFANTSHYQSKDVLRFLSKTEQLVFELQEIQIQEIVSFILELCKVPTRVKDIIDSAGLGQEMDEELIGLLISMVNIQLLLTELHPNIIGDDYFTRIGVHSAPDSERYIISEVNLKKGELNANVFRHIPELIKHLHALSKPDESSTLNRFIAEFSDKFDQQEIPIMVALDPELGVGYDELEQSTTGDEFITQFKNRSFTKPETDQGKLEAFLTDQLFPLQSDNRRDISLDGMSTEGMLPEMPLANTFSVIVRLDGEQVFVENIGGITANALLGRFTIANNDVLKQAKHIAEIESGSNPDVLFFDVANMAENKIDNINRRQNIYEWQLSILHFDTSPTPLSISDIMISVRGGEVFLRSKSLNKRLVPRIASAYNYSRSDLSLFRLLCDIQAQSIQTALSFSLNGMFPQQSYYPAVRFKNLIISPRMWRINEDGLKIIAQCAEASDLQNKMSEWGIDEPFKTGLADQTLCFDPCKPDDMMVFRHYALTQKSMLLKAANLPRQSMLENTQGESFYAEYVLNLTHTNQLYRSAGQLTSSHEATIRQIFAPGSEWLYFEIYGHPRRQNALLLSQIYSFIELYKSELKNWFFIRYTKNGHHLRLRLQLRSHFTCQEIITSLHDLLFEDLQAGWISDLQLKTYRRESERYGVDKIEEVEQHFGIDSAYVLQRLTMPLTTFDTYSICLDLLSYIQENLFDESEFHQFLVAMSDSFAAEHRLDSSDFKKLNQQFQAFSKISASVPRVALQDEFYASWVHLLKDLAVSDRFTLLSNVFHMHVNRLFSEAQRSHEMIIYYFALKMTLKIRAKSRQ